MLVVGEGVQESGHSRLLSVVCCSVFFSVDKAWSGGVSIAVLPARDPFSMLTVFVAGSFHGTFDAVSFGRRGSLEFGSHYAGDGAGRVASRKERGRMTNKQYRVDGTNIRARAGRSDKYLVVYISTPRFFCVVITSLYSSAMSRPITFEPLPLRPRSALQLYIGAACMFTISLLSALLALSYFYCPAQVRNIYFLCFTSIKLMRECTHRLHGYAHCVKTSTINILFRYSFL